MSLPSADRFVDSLEAAYRRLIESGAVSLSVEHDDDETVVRVEPAVPGAPRLLLRMTGSTGDLFLDDLDAFEVDSPEDDEEFAAFARALADGEVEVVFRRTLLGWRPAGVEWPGGGWSFPGLFGWAFRSRREKVQGYC
ncbi:hypothetical protein NQK81_39790 [Amycolatopsis roodepoortensis]|uniref:hypothetical protein n=1 Tax=Amycolatopsis roodepoortensis TaxID=700274 RepID=UPI00214C7EE1|nr:hypothetical protein [Amycolatopsis roodepoortensis]UUV30842.1 hypothetical protein NQK81_39790 [Amycolatopsis roodepoortensis]